MCIKYYNVFFYQQKQVYNKRKLKKVMVQIKINENKYIDNPLPLNICSNMA